MHQHFANEIKKFACKTIIALPDIRAQKRKNASKKHIYS